MKFDSSASTACRRQTGRGRPVAGPPRWDRRWPNGPRDWQPPGRAVRPARPTWPDCRFPSPPGTGLRVRAGDSDGFSHLLTGSSFRAPSMSACADALISFAGSSRHRQPPVRRRAHAVAAWHVRLPVRFPLWRRRRPCRPRLWRALGLDDLRARFSAWATSSEDFSLASRSASAERLAASSARFATFGRSQAFSDLGLPVGHRLCSGGQTYFIVIQMKSANQMAWPISVALIFTLTSQQ